MCTHRRAALGVGAASQIANVSHVFTSIGFGSKLKIRLRAKEALHSVQRKNVSQLGTGCEDPRLERTNQVACAAVSANPVIGVAYEATENCLDRNCELA
jgi:hypothetical protein